MAPRRSLSGVIVAPGLERHPSFSKVQNALPLGSRPQCIASALILFSFGGTQNWLHTDDPHLDGYLVLVYSSKGDKLQLHIVDPDTLTSTWNYPIEGDITIREEERDGLPFIWWTSTSFELNLGVHFKVREEAPDFVHTFRTIVDSKQYEIRNESSTESESDTEDSDFELGLQEPEAGVEEQEEDRDVKINTGSNSSTISEKGGVGGVSPVELRPEKLYSGSETKHVTWAEPAVLPEKRLKTNELGILDITTLVKSVEDDTLRVSGGFGFVRRGVIDYDPTDASKSKTNVEVAIKTLKISMYNVKNMWDRKRFRQEAVLWNKLDHENILKFIGTAEVPAYGLPQSFISPFMKNGNAVTYLRSNPHLPKLPVLRGTIAGIDYLHSKNVVHGDIKGNNILIADDGTPQLCDFGLAFFADDVERTVSTSVRRAGTKQWMAIELRLENWPGIYTSKQSDMWSYGMAVVELLTGAVPFPKLSDDGALLAISKGDFPQRPQCIECKDELWDFVQKCWRAKPMERPTAAEGLEVLTKLDEDAT